MDIAKLAKLSKIALSPEELAAMEADLCRIIALLDPLRELELPADGDDFGRAVTLSMLREDEPGESLPGGDFTVPRIIG